MNKLQNLNNMQLLSPAGDFECAVSAIEAGCDCVYIGGKNFSARSSANNFEDGDIERLVEYANNRGVLVLVAINTLYKEEEIVEVIEFAQKLYTYGVYALIVQDIGVASCIRKAVPDIKIHASTQMTAHSLEDVNELAEMGFDRVVLSRELSIEEIKYIKENTKIEIEVFVHGAICVSYSGQCLMSSLIGERSGNRGKCAQTCRLTFDLTDEKGEVIKTGHLISPKDMMTVELLEQLAEAGIDCLKIEGRMKTDKYVYQVTKMYRDQIERLKEGVTDTDVDAMLKTTQMFNRGGEMTTGYMQNYAGTDMMSVITPKKTGLPIGNVLRYDKQKGVCTIKLTENVVAGDGIEIITQKQPTVGTNINKSAKKGENLTINIDGNINIGDRVCRSFDKVLEDSLKNIKSTRQKALKVKVVAKIDKPLEITVYDNNNSITKTGELVTVAQNRPTDKDEIIKRISKTGNTPYTFDEIVVDIDDNIFVAIKELNELRRCALEEWEQLENKLIKREFVKIEMPKIEKSKGEQKLSVEIQNFKQLFDVINCNPDRIYININDNIIEDLQDSYDLIDEYSSEIFIKLPRISHTDDEAKLYELLKELDKMQFDGYMVCKYGQLKMVQEISKKQIATEYSFNIMNSLSEHYLEEKGVSTVTLSPELNLAEMQQIYNKNSEVIVYGKLPMMITKQCPVGLYVGGKKSGKFCSEKNKKNEYYLKDRKDILFDVCTKCDSCYSIFLNEAPVLMLDKWKDLKKLEVEYFKLIITTEKNISEIVKAYRDAIDGEFVDSDVIKQICIEQSKSVTHGHFYRGVQ